MTFIFDKAILWSLGTVIALIAIDTLMGWIIAFSKGEFDLRLAPQFLKTKVLPYVGPLVLLAIGAMSLEVIKAIYYPAALAATGAFGADIKDKLIGVFGKIEFEQ